MKAMRRLRQNALAILLGAWSLAVLVLAVLDGPVASIACAAS